MLKIARDPALTLIGIVAPLVTFLLSFAPLDHVVGTAINAVVVALAGVATSLVVADDKLAPTIAAAAQALITLAVGLGFNLSAEQQAGFLTIVGLATAAWIRTQVTAKVDEFGNVRDISAVRAARSGPITRAA